VAHSLSAKKRIRQNVKRRARNRARKGQVRSTVRSFSEALSSGDSAQAAETLRAAIRKIDQVAAKGTIHRNTAGRKKARLQRQYNALVANAG